MTSKKQRMSLLDNLAGTATPTPGSIMPGNRALRAARDAVDAHRVWELDPDQIDIGDRIRDRLDDAGLVDDLPAGARDLGQRPFRAKGLRERRLAGGREGVGLDGSERGRRRGAGRTNPVLGHGMLSFVLVGTGSPVRGSGCEA